MIDLHCHLIYETDDGAKTLEDSIRIFKEAYDAGFDEICCTPHYLVPQYTKSKAENEEKLEVIRNKLEKEKINIKLHLGNEIYINDNIDELLNKGIISHIAGTDYILVELPLVYQNVASKDILEELLYKGYKVILAHPERYVYAQKNLDFLYELSDIGIYFQSNYESLLGKYGLGAEKTVKKLLKEERIDLFSTDVHKANSTYCKMNKILPKIKKHTSEEYYKNITEKNLRKILNNENIEN